MPKRDFDMSGWTSTKHVRLRNRLFIGLFPIGGCVLERLYVSSDGQREWRRDSWCYSLPDHDIGDWPPL